MVRFAVRGGAIDGLYFYPKPVKERAIEIGLTDRKMMRRKRIVFMVKAAGIKRHWDMMIRIMKE